MGTLYYLRVFPSSFGRLDPLTYGRDTQIGSALRYLRRSCHLALVSGDKATRRYAGNTTELDGISAALVPTC